MLQLRPERDTDSAAVEALLDAAFGADRHHKISYRYRTGIAPVASLCLVAEEAGRLVGTIRYWPIRLGAAPALLLGPVATDPDRRAVGIGRALIFETLARATDQGWRLVFLVGDRDYYRRFSFAPVPPSIVMPGEDPARLQWRGLAGAALPPLGGELLRADGSRIEPLQEGRADGQQAFVRGDRVGHLAQARSQRRGHALAPDRLLEGDHVGLDREEDRPRAGQSP